MATLAETLRAHHQEILDRWTHEARRVAAARGLSSPEIHNVIPKYLDALADAGEELGRFTGTRRKHVERHLASRLKHGFPLAEIVEEFALLGRCIAATWKTDGPDGAPDHTTIANLFQELHLASVAVTDMFTHHMLEDEQTDKQYRRLIQSVAQEALHADGATLKSRLKEVLALVMEAMGAKSAALLFFNPQSQRLDMAASVGAADEELERYVSSLELSSFAGKVAASEETTSEWDAATTALTVSDTLRKSGIHSLLGVRLPPHHALLGVMYVGLGETREFTARESRRLESLGMQLAVHLANAKLYAELREHIELLRAERELREQFVAVLAHDLRGPLSAAKMGSQLLVRHPEKLDERRDLAARIDRNLELTDRMIRDLLDANRIRAGERLPLRIDRCDLGVVAREVYEEMVANFGERFVLDVAGRVLGFWSADELRRALWNLAMNAIKYGATDRPITLRVVTTADGAAASVHNWGAPIEPDDLQELFRPFSRTRAAQSGAQRGWGLGLTLVQGCALAHGGSVRVESSREAGTTFTIELPPDARPFQAAPSEPRVEDAAPTLH
jgi:signal transduction histidine kinase